MEWKVGLSDLNYWNHKFNNKCGNDKQDYEDQHEPQFSNSILLVPIKLKSKCTFNLFDSHSDSIECIESSHINLYHKSYIYKSSDCKEIAWKSKDEKFCSMLQNYKRNGN